MAEVGPILGPPLFGAVADPLGYRPAWLGLAGLTAIVTALLARGVDEHAP
ncbi:MAG: MFS transporter, partial [Chloroflexi bacterium]|nr:MFS transporter [Chloroflexota bacterium]